MLAEIVCLIVITILFQFAIGTYICGAVIRSLHPINKYVRITMTEIGMYAVGPAMLLVILFLSIYTKTSLIPHHLFVYFREDWVTYGLILSTVFFFLWLIGFILERNSIWNQLIAWTNVVVGIGVVASFATSLFLSQMEEWGGFHTYLLFFGATITIGTVSIVISTLLGREVKTLHIIDILKVLTIIGGIVLLFQLSYFPFYLFHLFDLSKESLQSILLSNYGILIGIHFLLPIIGVLQILYGLFYAYNSATFYRWSVGPMGLVILGEFFGVLILFYWCQAPVT